VRRVSGPSPCELLAAVADADEAFRNAVQAMLLPAIEAMQTGEQAAVDEASAGVVARVPEVMAAHVPRLTELYDQLEPLVPAEVAVHVATLRGYMGELAAGLGAATSFDAMSAVLDAPAGNDAHRAGSALATYRKATCG
jgi:hypothetical protein